MSSFTIIVPTLNSHKVLNRLINSLEFQTFKNWEIIFVDGNSRKEHIEWLKQKCTEDKRFIYKKQIDNNSGIYGAMNEGVKYISEKKWIFFWGSDDWLIDKYSLERIDNTIKASSPYKPDLIVFKGIYYDIKNKKNGRKAFFINNIKDCILETKDYKSLLYKGNTPPHQTTLINSRLLYDYGFYNNSKYKLAGDLDFFCKLIYKNNLNVAITNKYILYIATGGISGKLHLKRIKEVTQCYLVYFKRFFFIPLILRYLIRLNQII